MKSVLRRLFVFRSPRMAKQAGVLDGLTRMLKMSELEQVVLRTVDRRTLVQNGAKQLGIKEEELLAQLSSHLAIPYRPLVEAVDARHVTGKLGLADFRRSGAAPIIVQGAIAGLACVDPALVDGLRAALPGVPLYLASWSQISKALDESDRLYQADMRRVERDQEQKLTDAAQKVLTYMVREIASFGEENAVVKVEESSIVYEFTNREGRHGSGTIHPSVKQPLMNVLRDAARSGQSLAGPEEVMSQAVWVEVVEAERVFKLIWKLPRNLAAENNVPSADTLRDQVENAGISQLNSVEAKSEAVISATEPAPASSEFSPHADAPPMNGTVSSSERPVVLLVDDNVTFLKVLERFFERHALQAVMVHNGEEALSAIREGRVTPKAIVCDVHMPTMNGVEFVRQLRREPAHKYTPVVMLTSDQEVEMQVQFLTEGADAYVTKNQDPRILCAQVKRLLDRNSQMIAGAGLV